MTFISYAQNYEDVMLWRALKQINRGFYVDVGANDPVTDSVTQAFHERGWNGINIEPMQLYYELLCSARPGDINLPVAVASTDGDLIFYEIKETGLSTIDAKIAQKQSLAGWTVVEKKVAALTLNHILEKYVNGPIHFLKIDVEGAEYSVLQGLDLTRWRPWILMIEANSPSSQEPNFESWETLVLAANYEMAYFDGLNRFYVAREQSMLAELLKTPPNVFDGFISVQLRNALDERDRFQSKLVEIDGLREDLRGARSDLRGVRIDLDKLRDERDRLSLESSLAMEKKNQVLLELKELQTKFEIMLIQLNDVSADREKINQKLGEVWSHRDIVVSKLDEVFNDRHRIWLQLNEVWADRDRILAELKGVYGSRSYRITAPMRSIFGNARILRDKLIHHKNTPSSLKRSELKMRVKRYLRKSVNFLRKIPWIAIQLDGFNRRFPILRNRTATLVKDIIHEDYDLLVSTQPTDNVQLFSDDEKHFFDLFQRELSHRRIIKTEVE